MNPDTNNADTTPPAENQTPTPTPTAPVQPPVPTPPATEVTPVPTVETVKPSNAKKIILIASIGAGVVLLAVIAFIIFLLLTTVSKSDYRAATQQFNTISDESSTLTSSVSNLGYDANDASDDTFNQDVKTTQDSIEKIKTENTELGKLKAVRVGDGAKLYKTFDDKLTAYLAYGTDLITSVKNLRPAMATCAKVSDAEDAPSRVAALKACSSALGSVNDIPNAEMKSYVATLKDGYANYATTYESMAALTDPYGDQYDQYKTLRDKLYDIQDTINQASTDFSKALQKRDDELSVKDSANALGTYLTNKQQ